MSTNSDNMKNLEEETWAILEMCVNGEKILELDEGWAIIYRWILELRSRLEAGDLTFPITQKECSMLVYSIVFHVLDQQHTNCKELYDRCVDFLKDYINSVVLPALREQSDDQLLVGELLRRWKIHKAILKWMSNCFKYMERCFIRSLSLPRLKEVGTIYFRDVVTLQMLVNAKNAVIALIDQEREGEHIDGAMLKGVLAIFEELDMDFYKNDFEVEMLEHTGAYYYRKASSWILQDSYTDYMLRVEECLMREKDRVDRYLHPSSEHKVLEKVENGLLSTYMSHFLEDKHSGCLVLIRDRRIEDLSMMRGLFGRIPKGWESIANIFKQYVISEVTPLVKEAENDVMHNTRKGDRNLLLQEVASFVGKVIGLRDKYMKYAVDVFQHNVIFSSALKEVFQVLCNKLLAGSTGAEWLATLCHSVLKNDSTNKMLRRDEIIENVVEILEYISDKYMFAEFYSRKLSHRLLLDNGANVDLEQSILSKLIGKCDIQLTSKMGGMLRDLKRSWETQSRFKRYLDDNRNLHPGTEFTVTLLTPAFWPIYNPSQVNLPADMVRCVEAFQEFYSTEAQHRQLKWIFSLGTCDIIGRFDGGSRYVIATAYQAALLLLFNDSEKLSCSDIRTLLNLEEEEVYRLLYSLACAKYKILLKNPNTTSVAAADDFEINFNFTSRRGKVRIPMPMLEERTKGAEDISKDRRFVIDACIMRIMKAQRVLRYEQLMSEVATQLGISKLCYKEIKSRIEDLFEREYLERDREEVDLLRYLP